MRRHFIAGVVAAFGLVVTLPLAAGAATGTFTYTYLSPGGAPLVGTVTDQDNGTCVTVAGGNSEPAFDAVNNTDALAFLSEDPHCRYRSESLAPGDNADGATLRSVLFS